MRYNEIISEARDYPLYHFMDITKAIHVFETDTMEARWQHEIPGIGKVMGNSFSRNKFLNIFRPIRITIDQAKLATRHRIIPLDGERIYQHTQRYMYDDKSNALNRSGDRTINNRRNDKNAYTLQEEFVIGDISNLHKYVTKIDLARTGGLNNYQMKEAISISQDFADKFNIPIELSQSLKDYVADMAKYDAMYDDEDDDVFADLLGESYKWTEPRGGGLVKSGKEVVVKVNIEKLDASFKKDSGFYVGRAGEGGISGRYSRFDSWIKQGVPIEMPEVCLDWKGEITFVNGRHRFAWFRDHGLDTMPVVVPAEQAAEITSRFG